jgi:hypothetical protein
MSPLNQMKARLGWARNSTPVRDRVDSTQSEQQSHPEAQSEDQTQLCGPAEIVGFGSGPRGFYFANESNGWEQRRTSEGFPIFYNHNMRICCWVDPCRSTVPEALDGFQGWEYGHTPGGRRFFIDHNTSNTSWSDPRHLLYMQEFENGSIVNLC